MALEAATLRERSGVEFGYQSTPGGVRAIASLGNQRAEMLLEWAFGAGIQGMTPVGRADGCYIEHRISYFTQPDGPARTGIRARTAFRATCRAPRRCPT